ncbi:TylF/MycF/NovP-related O-methyltransferase [Nocardioides ultimimeridianus]
MSLSATVNRVLTRTTGYRLTRETPEQREVALRRARRAGARKAWERAERQAAAREERRKARTEQRRQERLERQRLDAERREAERAEAERTGANLPADWDETKRSIVAQVKPRTMTGPPKLAPLIEAVRYVARHRIPGDVVECGVWRGGSMMAIALTLAAEGDTSRELHLFDTFEGMPPPTEEDTRLDTGGERITAQEALDRVGRDARVWAVAGLEDVQQGMAETGYPADRVHFHQGLVEDTVPDLAPATIALLRLDTDWYASTKHELEHLYQRLSPGGVLILDDYADWEGARRATDEWLAATGERLLLVPIGQGVIAVKPG